MVATENGGAEKGQILVRDLLDSSSEDLVKNVEDADKPSHKSDNEDGKSKLQAEISKIIDEEKEKVKKEDEE